MTIASKLRNMVIRGRVAMSGVRQGNATSTFAEEAQDQVGVVEIPGVSSNPDGGFDAILLSLNGSATRRVAIPMGSGSSVQAPAGGLLLFAPSAPEDSQIELTDEGAVLRFGTLKIEADAVEIEADRFEWNGKTVIVEGDRDSDGDRQRSQS